MRAWLRGELASECVPVVQQIARADAVAYALVDDATPALRAARLFGVALGRRVDVSAHLGTRRIEAFMHCVHTCGVELTALQDEFVRLAVETLLALAYGADYARLRDAVCEYHGIRGREPRPVAIFQVGRQYGKTTVMSVVAAAMAASFHSTTARPIRMVVIAQNEAIAAQLVALARACALRMPHVAGRVEARTARNVLSIRSATGKALTSVVALAASSNGLRGTQADAAMVDEGAFTPRDVYTDYLGPMIQNTAFALLVCTSPPTMIGPYTQLRDLRGPGGVGSPVNTLVVRSVCSACEEASNLRCTHCVDTRPLWRADPSRAAIAGAMLGVSAGMRELAGVDVQTNTLAFAGPAMAAWGARAPESAARCHTIVIGVDPSGGGISMEAYVAVALEYRPDTFEYASLRAYVVGMERIMLRNATRERPRAVALAFARRIGALYPDASLVLAVESNFNPLDTCSIAAAFVEGAPRIVVMGEHRDGVSGVGVLTTALTKASAVAIMNTLLGANALVFAEPLLTSAPDPSEARAALLGEAARFRRRIQRTQHRDGSWAETAGDAHYDGKVGGEQDDAIMALLIALFSAFVFETALGYESVRPHPFSITPLDILSALHARLHPTRDLVVTADPRTGLATHVQNTSVQLGPASRLPDPRAP